MEKALARNPNLLRTLLGLSTTLILVLGYAVYSASLDSEYYIYETTLKEEIVILSDSGNDTSDTLVWLATTSGSVSWTNFTLEGAPSGSILSVTSGGSRWWSHPSLGDATAERFVCLEPNSDFEMVNHCSYSFNHQRELDESGSVLLRGLLNEELPLSGKGTVRADDLQSATEMSEEILKSSNSTVTWSIELVNSEPIDRGSVSLTFTSVKHDLTTVEQFELNPFVESVWSLTALMTCFVMGLGLPLGIYYASNLREKRVELERASVSEE